MMTLTLNFLTPLRSLIKLIMQIDVTYKEGLANAKINEI